MKIYRFLVNSMDFQHPGGEEVLVDVAGKDATKEFDDIGHSDAAMYENIDFIFILMFLHSRDRNLILIPFDILSVNSLQIITLVTLLILKKNPRNRA